MDQRCKSGNSDFIIGKYFNCEASQHVGRTAQRGLKTQVDSAVTGFGHPLEEEVVVVGDLWGAVQPLCVCVWFCQSCCSWTTEHTWAWFQHKWHCYSRLVILFLVHPLILSSRLCCPLRKEIMPLSAMCASRNPNIFWAVSKAVWPTG